jgi:MFS family permease
MNKNNSLTQKERIVYVVIAAICMVATFPGRTNGLGFITEFILSDLHIDRTVYGYYNLAATLIGSLFCIPAGTLLDRYGCRRTLVWILSALGLSVLLMSMANSHIIFVIALMLTRGFGQSALSVASMTLISKHFPKEKLGMGMGLYSVLTAVFFIVAFWAMGTALTHLAPLRLSFVCRRAAACSITIAHWRIAWGTTGLVLFAVCVPAILLFVRRHVPVTASNDAPLLENATPADISFTRALRFPVFWLFALSIAFFGLVNSGIALYNEDILAERGFDAQMYYFLMVLPLPFALLSNLLVGYLAHRIKITYLLAGCLFFTGLVKILFPFIQTVPQVYAYTITLAISGGGLTVLFFIAWAAIFGRRDVGRIQGVAQMLSVFASALGPLLFAYSKEWTASYSPAFLLCGLLNLIFAFAALIIKIPHQQKNHNI